MPSDTYAKFFNVIREVATLRSVEALLDWDQETYMPPRGAQHRGEQGALVAGLAHERFTSDELGRLLEQVEREGAQDDPTVVTNVRETRRQFDRAVKVPTELVRDLARSTAMAKPAWAQARRESRFELFAPHLERLLDLKRRVADHVGYKGERYDALMDEFEPGMTAAKVAEIFDGLKRELVPLVAEIAAAKRKPDLEILKRRCAREAQVAFSRRLAEAIGFDFNAGRLDVSTHPFCTHTCPLDVRITSRYDEHFLPMSVFGTLHEVGHALYEQGLDPQQGGAPAGCSVSLGIHESQSRMWENIVGRSRPFWQHFFGELQERFPSLSDVSLETWYFAINNVQPSLIRVEADEVTYNLHVMLRFDVERRMLNGTLRVADVPEAWNTSVKEMLGIRPKDDAEGCLQDIHWSGAMIGYFPTYALGNLCAAQFFEAARRALPGLDESFRKGDFRPLLTWLRENIHRHGMRFRADELVKRVTGESLSHAAFMRALREKFGKLYGL